MLRFKEKLKALFLLVGFFSFVNWYIHYRTFNAHQSRINLSLIESYDVRKSVVFCRHSQSAYDRSVYQKIDGYNYIYSDLYGKNVSISSKFWFLKMCNVDDQNENFTRISDKPRLEENELKRVFKLLYSNDAFLVDLDILSKLKFLRDSKLADLKSSADGILIKIETFEQVDSYLRNQSAKLFLTFGINGDLNSVTDLENVNFSSLYLSLSLFCFGH